MESPLRAPAFVSASHRHRLPRPDEAAQAGVGAGAGASAAHQSSKAEEEEATKEEDEEEASEHGHTEEDAAEEAMINELIGGTLQDVLAQEGLDADGDAQGAQEELFMDDEFLTDEEEEEGIPSVPIREMEVSGEQEERQDSPPANSGEPVVPITEMDFSYLFTEADEDDNQSEDGF